jgi:uncharacterized protein YjiS (DUF1127 family)
MRSQLLTHEERGDCFVAGTEFETTKKPLGRRFGHLLAWIALSLQIRRERKQLARLSDHELRDIGVSREQADNESYQGLVSIPPNRLKRVRFRRR